MEKVSNQEIKIIITEYGKKEKNRSYEIKRTKYTVLNDNEPVESLIIENGRQPDSEIYRFVRYVSFGKESDNRKNRQVGKNRVDWDAAIQQALTNIQQALTKLFLNGL